MRTPYGEGINVSLMSFPAHQWLAVRGILHCDISPGNLLLASGPSAGVCGILTDFDGAYIDEELFRVARDTGGGLNSPIQTNIMASSESHTLIVPRCQTLNCNRPHGVEFVGMHDQAVRSNIADNMTREPANSWLWTC